MDIDDYMSMLNGFSNESWDLLHIENPLVDGYDFKGADFKAKSIVRKPCAQNGIKLKFITELEQIDNILGEISTTKIIYQFFLDAPYYRNESIQMHLIKIPSTDCINKMI